MTGEQVLFTVVTSIGTIGGGIISYFLKSTMKSLADAMKENIDLHQRVLLLEQKSESDLNHLSMITNQKLDTVTLEINHLNGNVKQYTNNVTNLIRATENNTHAIENLIKISEKHEKKFEILDETVLNFFRDNKK